MITYYLVFLLGLLAGALLRRPRAFQLAHYVVVGCGYLLITLFGFQMASSSLIGNALLRDLLSSAVIAIAAATGSVACSFLFFWLVKNMTSLNELTSVDGYSGATACQSPLYVWRPVIVALALLMTGIVSGRVLPAVEVDLPIKTFLLLMIVAVGVQSAQELRSLSPGRLTNRSATRSALVLFFGLPVAVMAGTLLFCAVTGLLLPYGWRDSMLCGAPMGWQTLGGPMVQELRGVELGNIAFLSNMFRDVVALVMIPLVSRKRYALLGVTPGAVSSMDILLPGIMAASGRQSLMYAMWVGASCSFWAPILIYLIAKAC